MSEQLFHRRSEFPLAGQLTRGLRLFSPAVSFVPELFATITSPDTFASVFALKKNGENGARDLSRWNASTAETPLQVPEIRPRRTSLRTEMHAAVASAGDAPCANGPRTVPVRSA